MREYITCTRTCSSSKKMISFAQFHKEVNRKTRPRLQYNPFLSLWRILYGCLLPFFFLAFNLIPLSPFYPHIIELIGVKLSGTQIEGY